MRKTIALFAVAAVHFIAARFVLIYSMALAMNRFDDPLARSPLTPIVKLMVHVLNFPLIPLLDRMPPPLVGSLAPKWVVENLLFAANSLLWAACFLLILQLIARRRTVLRPA